MIKSKIQVDEGNVFRNSYSKKLEKDFSKGSSFVDIKNSGDNFVESQLLTKPMRNVEIQNNQQDFIFSFKRNENDTRER